MEMMPGPSSVTGDRCATGTTPEQAAVPEGSPIKSPPPVHQRVQSPGRDNMQGISSMMTSR
eukprot:9355533-Pyramimonas_sp.AAC.1